MAILGQFETRGRTHLDLVGPLMMMMMVMVMVMVMMVMVVMVM